MKIVIFGMGYVGITAAACLASEGHRVVGVDVSSSKVQEINSGRTPIAEPGLQELITKALADGLLSATTSIDSVLDDADLAIVCVGTPSAVDGSHNMSYIADVTRQIAAATGAGRVKPLTVAYRSTMRPGTIEELIIPVARSVIGDRVDEVLDFVYNPEFLRESSAIKDYFAPPKIVIGTKTGAGSAVMDEVNKNISCPVFNVRFREAEITKFFDNTWHAMKVAYANEIGRICENLDISAKAIHEIFISDTKLNISAYYMRPGGAFGGSCLPKDVRALQYLSAEIGANTHLIDSLIRSNESHKQHQFLQISELLSPNSNVLIAGLAFKAKTDDLRESPNIDLVRKLMTAGHTVRIYDPHISGAKLVGQNLGYAYSHLPSYKDLLVSLDEANKLECDLVIGTNSTVLDIDLNGRKYVDLNAIS